MAILDGLVVVVAFTRLKNNILDISNNAFLRAGLKTGSLTISTAKTTTTQQAEDDYGTWAPDPDPGDPEYDDEPIDYYDG
jgi:hypothetical protein